MRRSLKVVLDLALIAMALPLALLMRENFVPDVERLIDHLPFLVATLTVAVPFMIMLGVDRMVWRYCMITDQLQLAVAVTLIMLGAILITFGYNRLEGISRAVPALQAILATAAMIGARVAYRYVVGRKAMPRPFAPIERNPQQSVLLVGLSSLSDLYVKAVCEFAGERIRVVGIVDHSSGFDGMRVQRLPVFGGARSAKSVIEELAVHGVFVDRVVVTTAVSRLPDISRRDIEAFAVTSPIPVEYFADNLADLVGWAGADQARQAGEAHNSEAGLTFAFSSERIEQLAQRPYWRVKRSIDIVASLLLIVVLWPVALIVTLLAAWDVGLPVIFMQRRPGVVGRPFSLYKFRTMASLRDRHGRLRSDVERLGRIGRFLRASRLDELPQLWNILAGEMSFIGPRPLLPLDQSPAFASRLLVRPGLTGWSQIHGGRKVSPEDKAALDVWYIANASMKHDLKIIWGTFAMLARGEIVDQAAIDSAWRELRASGIWRPISPIALPEPKSGDIFLQRRKSA